MDSGGGKIVLSLDKNFKESVQQLNYTVARILTVDRELYEIRDPDIIKKLYGICYFQMEPRDFLRISNGFFIPNHQIREIKFK